MTQTFWGCPGAVNRRRNTVIFRRSSKAPPTMYSQLSVFFVPGSQRPTYVGCHTLSTYQSIRPERSLCTYGTVPVVWCMALVTSLLACARQTTNNRRIHRYCTVRTYRATTIPYRYPRARTRERTTSPNKHPNKYRYRYPTFSRPERTILCFRVASSYRQTFSLSC